MNDPEAAISSVELAVSAIPKDHYGRAQSDLLDEKHLRPAAQAQAPEQHDAEVTSIEGEDEKIPETEKGDQSPADVVPISEPTEASVVVKNDETLVDGEVGRRLGLLPIGGRKELHGQELAEELAEEEGKDLNPTAVREIKHIERTAETLHDMACDVVRLLKEAGETVGVAESLTGGGIMAALTSVGGASAVFRGGVVSYATPLKQLLLNVDKGLISQHGVIHGDVAAQMATGARTITTFHDIPTSWGISTTGVAGPEPQDDKPVGTVFIGIASTDGSQAWGPFHFPGARDRVREATIIETLSRMREILTARARHN